MEKSKLNGTSRVRWLYSVKLALAPLAANLSTNLKIQYQPSQLQVVTISEHFT